jgi:hypothetical protein
VDVYEITTHSFIVKLWREQQREDGNHFIWRGHITHVPSGTRRYLRDLNEIALFMTPYLEGMQVRADPQRIHGWFSRWKGRINQQKQLSTTDRRDQ